MGKENEYVLAMYDVRGKQDYIFRGRKLKEIIGGSLVIRDIFDDELFPAAKEVNGGSDAIFSYKKIADNNSFSKENFETHLECGYLGEVVYDGGGNFFVLYKNKETYVEINKRFTKRVMEHTYSLTVLCSCIEGVDFDDYKSDRDKLYAVNRVREARINPQMPAQVLPFTQVDYANSLPLYSFNNSVQRKLTKEAARKYEKFEQVRIKNKTKTNTNTDLYDEKVLDNIVKEKGKDSWIAIIYIDGNNMGAKVQKRLQEDPISYEAAIKELREFSSGIQKNYIDDRISAIDEALQKKYEDGEESYKRRLVVYAGDEINIILNAHDALDAVKAYFAGMTPKMGSACAGIAIFKSHMPYSDAYRIAEQCCESGKQWMKERNIPEINMVDFHYCQGAIGTDLEKIREREVGDIISKPWVISYSGVNRENDWVTIDMISELVKRLNTCSRTNIKGLLECARFSESQLFTELTRMQLRRKNAKNEVDLTNTEGYVEKKEITKDLLRKMIFDVVTVYDLWFGKDEGRKVNEKESEN